MNPLSKALDNQTIWNITDRMHDILSEFSLSAKIRKSVKVRVIVFDGILVLGTFTGLLSQDRSLVYVPMLESMWFYPKIYQERGRGIVFVSMRYHYTLDMEKLSGIAEAQKYSAILSFKYVRNFVTLKIKNATGTIDMNIWDNIESPDFIASALKCIRTKALEFLSEIPQHKLILYCSICALIGVIVGGIGLLILLNYTVIK